MHIHSLTKLAAELKRSKGYISKVSKRPWFPAKETDGWDVAKVRAAIDANVRGRSES